MAHFAKIDENNIVTQVIVVEKDVIDSGLFGDPSEWVQTSYNTQNGMHLLGGIPLRKNFAGEGFTYDPLRDAFIPPKPYNSWILDEETCNWKAPIEQPVDGKLYNWNEETLSWDDISQGFTTPVEVI